MINRKNILIFLITFFFLSFSYCEMTYSQAVYSTKLNFSGSIRHQKTTKKYLKKFKKYFLLIDGEFIEFSYSQNGFFNFPNLTNKQLCYLNENDAVLVKVKNKRNCYFVILPTKSIGMNLNESLILNFRIYNSRKNLYMQYLVSPSPTKEQMEKLLQFKREGMIPRIDNEYIINLKFISCQEYRGEYEKYRFSRHLE